jgi:hypothetical protein
MTCPFAWVAISARRGDVCPGSKNADTTDDWVTMADVDVQLVSPDSADGRPVLAAFFRDVLSRYHGRMPTLAEIDAVLACDYEPKRSARSGAYSSCRRFAPMESASSCWTR